MAAIQYSDNHETFLQKMWNGTSKSNKEIIQELGALAIDKSDIHGATQLVCELITRPPYVYTVNRLGPSHLKEFLLSPRNTGNGMLRMAIGRFTDTIRRCFIMYEEDYKSTRETLNT